MSGQIDFKRHFNKAATIYNLTMGQISIVYARHILSLLPPITHTSTVHDNAAGPGVVAFEIFSQFPNAPRPTIYATDFSEGMISAVQDAVAADDGLRASIHASTQNSESLSFADDTFTHSITNFGIFIMPAADEAAREIYRTLKPGGSAALTTWKTNGFINWIHRTQQAIRPDLPPLQVYGREWTGEEKLRDTLEGAGFAKGNIRIQAIEADS